MRKPTKCFYCREAPMILVTSVQTCHPDPIKDRKTVCGFRDRGMCLAHGKDFVFNLKSIIVPMYEVPPWREKKAAKRK